MSPRRSSIGVVTTLAALCLLGTLAATAPPTTAQSTSVVLTNATHTPSTPTAGDTFVVSATVRNQAGAAGSFTVNEVVVEVPDQGPAGYSDADDLGTLSPGSSIRFSLPATVDDTGWHQLRVLVYGETPTGRAVRVTHPITVHVVERQRPQLDVEFDEAVVGSESAANVTVANGLDESIRNLRVEVAGESVHVGRSSRVRSALASETEANYTFDLTPRGAGEHRLTARLTYTTAAGERQTVTERITYTAEPLDRDVRLDVGIVRGETPAAEVTVVNLGNAPLEDVSVTGESGQASVSTAVVDRVGAQRSETVRLNVTDVASVGQTLTVSADYEVGGDRRQTTRELDGAFVPGRVDLTGIDVVRTADGAVRITGTASNVGTTRVEAVTVGVQRTESVTPANPAKEYFVGSIDASDFSSFTVNAEVDGENGTTIPLTVTYLVDSEERTRTIEATYDPPETPERDGSALPFVGVGVVLAVAVAGVFLWRRRRAA